MKRIKKILACVDLSEYSLSTLEYALEMPEAWNQMTFDDHVHDANTSGRNPPTHLIMDTWIKGICRLRVIYHHYLDQFNERHLSRLERELGTQMEKICPEAYIRFALPGQPSMVSQAEYIHQIIQGMEDSQVANRVNRREKLMDILHDLEGLKYMYGNKKLKSRIESDSSGKNHQAFGMGFGVLSTLGPKAVRKTRKDSSRLVLPAKINICQQVTYPPCGKGHLQMSARLPSAGFPR